MCDKSPDKENGNPEEFKAEENFFNVLKQALSPHLLRRFKRDVLKDLPLRKEVIVRIEMTQAQKDLSKKILLQNMQELVEFEKKNANKSGVCNIFTYMR